MEIKIQDKSVQIKKEAFTMQSDQWLWDDRLTDGEKIKLMKIYWRYDFFRSKAKEKALETRSVKIPATNYLYMTQEGYADLLKVPRNKVSTLFKKLEDCSYLVRVKGGTTKTVNGVLENIPRDYVVVLNSAHEDYNKDLEDVWKALSQRLGSMEDKDKINNVTYKQMLKSYEKLFNDKKRYVKVCVDVVEESEEVNFGVVSDTNISESPNYETIPLSAYGDVVVDQEEDSQEEIDKDFLNYCGLGEDNLPF